MNANVFAIIIFIVVFVVAILVYVAVRNYLSSREVPKVEQSFKLTDVPKESKGSHQKTRVPEHETVQKPQTEKRINVLGGSAAAVLGVLAAKVFSLQVINGSEYSEEAEDNMTSDVSVAANRGRILDCNGEELAINRGSRTVIGDSTVEDNTKVVHRLSLVLGIPQQAVRSRLMDETSGLSEERTIASDVSMRAISYISENPTLFPGVSVETKTTRYYPNGSVAAHVLGYTGTISEDELEEDADGTDYESGDVVGKTGIEGAYETLLQGTKGTKTYKVNSSGETLGLLSEIESDDGNDIELTIDLDIQKAAEEALEDAMSNARSSGYSNAYCGAIIAMDVTTGGILAMASAPSYDPNDFTGGISNDQWEELTDEDSGYPMSNRAIAGQYPAASTYKAFTGLAGLEYGLVDTSTTYYCSGTWTGMGEDYPKNCWEENGHGARNIYTAIADSCDVYFYEIAKSFYEMEDTDPDALQEYLRSWGFGSAMGIDISGELSGRVPDAEWKEEYYWETPEDAQWLPGDLANMIIGQGDVLVTPLQMVTAYAGIANGKLHVPHLLRRVLNKDGQEVISETVQESEFEPNVSEENLQIMRDALHEVTTSGGASSVFADFPYEVAAKSGTGETGSSTRDDYAWFCAYAPFDDPKYAVSCLIEEGGGGTSIAGPAVRELLAALLGVEDDEDVSVTETGER